MNEKDKKLLQEVELELSEAYYKLEEHLEEINSPIRFKIYSTYRSPEEQFENWRKGRTKKGDKWFKTGQVVTYCDGYSKLSPHNFKPSQAVDIIATYNGKVTWDIKYYYYLSGKLEMINKRIRCGIHFVKNGKPFEDGGHSEINS